MRTTRVEKWNVKFTGESSVMIFGKSVAEDLEKYVEAHTVLTQKVSIQFYMTHDMKVQNHLEATCQVSIQFNSIYLYCTYLQEVISCLNSRKDLNRA